jgi:excinuclease ABC subunit C
MSKLSAAILQASANPNEVAVFLYDAGRLRGPVPFSTIGMRIQNEQSGSSSLFAQPMALEPVPEEETSGIRESGLERATSTKVPRTMLETRMQAVLDELRTAMAPPNTVVRQGHLALLKRWYYRPEVKREGEVVFPDADSHWPTRALLRATGRVAAKSIARSTVDH